MNRRAIVLFTGDPRREASRKGLPSRLLTALHRQLVATVRQTHEVTLIVASDDDRGFRLDAGDDASQPHAATFAAKIDAAFRFAYDRGCESVILLAGDVAGVDPALLETAFATLERDAERCVIGPSGDGGLYLLGMNRASSAARTIDWTRLPWFGPTVTAALVDEIHAAGGGVTLLRTIDDVDSYRDAVRLALLPPIPRRAPRPAPRPSAAFEAIASLRAPPAV